jgi:hypothetical protein
MIQLRRLVLLFVLLILTSGAWADGRSPIEIFKISQMLEHIQPDDMVIWDLDNTLITARQLFGSDQWFDAEIKRLDLLGVPPAEAKLQTQILVTEVGLHLNYDYIEANTLETIRAIEAKSAMSFVLTARREAQMAAVFKYLNELGLEFTANAPDLPRQEFGPKMIYEKGIVLCKLTRQGNCFRPFS